MKSSNSIDGTDAFGDNPGTFESQMRSDPATLQAYALYLARFVEEYAGEGLIIEHLQPQNEPGYSTRYPSCLWSPGLLGTFVNDYLGPTLAERNLATQIWFGTLSNNNTYASHAGGLADNPGQTVVGVGLQWNTIGNVQSLADQGYLVMQTEHRCGNYPWEAATFNPNAPPNDHAYAEESWGLIKQWLEAGVHVYSAWNMVLDTNAQNLYLQRPWPQNALLAVERPTAQLIVTPAYHVFRHVSQFVEPGAVRLGVSGGDALAFRNPDGGIVTVLHNPGAQASDTTLAMDDTTVRLSVPAGGWATVNWKD
jgi:glucosylceramidase